MPDVYIAVEFNANIALIDGITWNALKRVGITPLSKCVSAGLLSRNKTLVVCRRDTNELESDVNVIQSAIAVATARQVSRCMPISQAQADLLRGSSYPVDSRVEAGELTCNLL